VTAGRLRVLIADDQDLFRAGFSMIVNAQPDMAAVGEAADGSRAVAEAVRLSPDIVLMDIRMPGLDGVAATSRIRAATDARVLILTMFDQDEYVYDALRAGASGFLLKDIRRDELTNAIRAVVAGGSLLAPSVTHRLIEDMLGRGHADPRLSARLRQLTARETEVLRLIARGLSNTEIGAVLFVSDNTVKSHVSSLLAKTGLRDRAQAASFAYESGAIAVGNADLGRLILGGEA
jgi:DNA-binding NarL/FixJ family response regulator